jgi:hypothetical protein
MHDLIKCLVGALIWVATVAHGATPSVQQQLTVLDQRIHALQAQVSDLKAQLKQTPRSVVHRSSAKPQYYADLITTSQTVGLSSKYDGSDLVVSYSSMSPDVKLLKQRRAFGSSPRHGLWRPDIELSGGIEGQASWEKTPTTHSSDLDLTRFELDVLAEFNPWVSAIGSLSYDKAAGIAVDRTKNSNISLKRAFVTLGQLKRTPWYASFGQMYMPFGRYSSLMLSSALTTQLGRITGRGAVLGYYGLDAQDNGWLSTLFLMQGKTRPLNASSEIDQGGANISFSHHFNGKQHIQLGAGVVRNLADADHILETLDAVDDKDQLTRRVPGMDAYAIIGYAPWRLSVEYVKALKSLEADSIVYGRYGAMQVALDYALGVRNIPSNLYLVYGHSSSASNLDVPKSNWAVGLYMHLWKNTLQALEYRYNRLYAGQTSVNEHSVLLQLGAYF